jgi:hypothetical protein
MFNRTSTNTLDRYLKCSYSNARGCGAQRAMKTSGSHHRFCELHRDEARANQRAYLERQRRRIGVTNRQTNEANAGRNGSAFLPIDITQPDQVETVLAVLGHQNPVDEAVEESSSDVGSSEGLAANALGSLSNIPSNHPLRMLVDDISEGAASVLLAQFEPWLPEFITETYESVMADL